MSRRLTWKSVLVRFAALLALTTPVVAQSQWADAGWDALQDGKGETAASAFRQALAERPRDPQLLFGAGAAAHLLGRESDAREHLRKALELEPRLTPASALLGEIVYNQGDVALAIKTYEQAVVHAPRNRAMQERLAVWRNEASKVRYTNGPYSIMFEGPTEERLAAHTAAVLDAAYWRIAKALGAYPSDPITVILYTEKQFHDVTGAPEWAAGLFDTRIRIPVRGALRTMPQFDRVITHELVHAMVASLAPHGVPTWLHEGLAVHFEPGDADAAERRLTMKRAFVPLKYLEGGFERLNDRQAQIVYDESVVAAHALMTRVGTGMSLLLQDLGTGMAFAQAVERFGFTSAELEAGLSRRIQGGRATR
jgi:tetratricopeptide (TPR) repeat protein